MVMVKSTENRNVMYDGRYEVADNPFSNTGIPKY